MNDSTRSRRTRQRPRTKKIRRHQDQPLLWPEGPQPRPVFRQRQVRLQVEQRGQVTPYGGLALVHQLAMRLELDKDLNRALPLLKIKLPYFESDHVLTHVYNLYAGGSCIEDIAHLQHSQALKHLLGACRIPDPGTAGDFLRRFHEPHLTALQGIIDAAREKVWKQMPRARRQTGTVDLDSTIKEVHGECKQGADFSYNGKWSYHPLLATLAETHEPLRTINRPGNAASADGAVAVLHGVLPMVKRHFGQVRVRGDSKFYQHGIIAACRQHGARFALCMDPYAVLQEKADALPPQAWKPFSAHPAERATTDKKSRRKRHRCRSRRARQRGYTNLATTREWVAEFDYTLPDSDSARAFGVAGQTYRVAVRRQQVDVSEGQERLYTEYRDRFIITDFTFGEMNAAEVVRFAYGRCDQENIIEQLKNGIAAMRMPTGELLANGAFLMAGQLAWCLRAWLSLLALPKETIRWEWKWFRQSFVYVAAKITQSTRRAVVSLSAAHRWVQHLLIAAQRLQTFVFQ